MALDGPVLVAFWTFCTVVLVVIRPPKEVSMQLCPVAIALVSIELLYLHLALPSESIRSGKNMNVNNPPPYIRRWHPGVSVPPDQWEPSEQNCINALLSILCLCSLKFQMSYGKKLV